MMIVHYFSSHTRVFFIRANHSNNKNFLKCEGRGNLLEKGGNIEMYI